MPVTCQDTSTLGRSVLIRYPVLDYGRFRNRYCAAAFALLSIAAELWCSMLRSAGWPWSSGCCYTPCAQAVFSSSIGAPRDFRYASLRIALTSHETSAFGAPPAMRKLQVSPAASAAAGTLAAMCRLGMAAPTGVS